MNFEPIPRLLGNMVAPLLFFRDRYLGTLAAWPHPNQPVRSMFRAQYSSNEEEDGFQTYVQPPWWEESEGFESSFHCVWSQRSSNIFLDLHRLLPAPFCLVIVASTKTPMPSLISRFKVQKCPFPMQDSAARLTSPTNVAWVFSNRHEKLPAANHAGSEIGWVSTLHVLLWRCTARKNQECQQIGKHDFSAVTFQFSGAGKNHPQGW